MEASAVREVSLAAGLRGRDEAGAMAPHCRQGMVLLSREIVALFEYSDCDSLVLSCLEG